MDLQKENNHSSDTDAVINRKFFYTKSFQFTIWIFNVFIFWSFVLGIFALSPASPLGAWRDLIALFYYMFFLYFLKRNIKLLTRTDHPEANILQKINTAKWALLFISVILIALSVKMTDFQSLNMRPAEILRFLFLSIFNPNIAFIVITFLVFYLSRVLTLAKNLKEEQTLTI